MGRRIRTGSLLSFPFAFAVFALSTSAPLYLYSQQNSSTCSGLCSPGFYCPEGSISPQEVLCGDPTRYCPEGSPHPLSVSSGYFSIGGNVSTRSDQSIAPRGFYALNGLLFTCPAGRYGTREGEDNALCTGECLKGFYCPGTSSFLPPIPFLPIPLPCLALSPALLFPSPPLPSPPLCSCLL
jgi:hypothetical protein